MIDHPSPTPTNFADELARMVVDAYARRMGEHTTAVAELAAVRAALECDEDDDAVESAGHLQNEVERLGSRLKSTQAEADALRRRVAKAEADALTDDDWSRIFKATKVNTRAAALRRIEAFGRIIAEKDAALGAIATAGLKAAQAVGVERAEDIPAAWKRLRTENERLRAELAAATNTPRDAAESE